MAQYVEVKDAEKLIKHAIEDSWELDYTLEKLKEINKADVIERSKIDKAIDEIIEKSFISDIYNDRTDDEIIKLDDVLEILKRSIGE